MTTWGFQLQESAGPWWNEDSKMHEQWSNVGPPEYVEIPDGANVTVTLRPPRTMKGFLRVKTMGTPGSLYEPPPPLSQMPGKVTIVLIPQPD